MDPALAIFPDPGLQQAGFRSFICGIYIIPFCLMPWARGPRIIKSSFFEVCYSALLKASSLKFFKKMQDGIQVFFVRRSRENITPLGVDYPKQCLVMIIKLSFIENLCHTSFFQGTFKYVFYLILISTSWEWKYLIHRWWNVPEVKSFVQEFRADKPYIKN